eukprot:549229-Prorocentrum_minimum.AAC.3
MPRPKRHLFLLSICLSTDVCNRWRCNTLAGEAAGGGHPGGRITAVAALRALLRPLRVFSGRAGGGGRLRRRQRWPDQGGVTSSAKKSSRKQ